MIRMFKIELAKLFGNYRFYAGTLGIIWGIWLAAYDNLIHGGGRSGMIQLLVESSRGEPFLLSCILCVIGGAYSFCGEEKTGNSRMVVARSGCRNYIVAKLFSSFTGGFAMILFGNLFSFAGLACMVGIKYQGAVPIMAGGNETADLFYYIVGRAMLGALLSEVGLMVTTIFLNFFVGMAMPILLYYFWLSLADWFHFSVYLRPDCYFGYVSRYWSSWQAQMLYALLMTACFSYVIYLICARMIRRRLEND